MTELKMKPGDSDHQDRVRVVLVAAEQKVYRKFRCIWCESRVPIAEICDDLVYLSDVADETALKPDQTGAVRIKCTGKYCRTWYEFILRPPRNNVLN